MCPGPWLTVTMGELSLCLGTSQHGAPLSRPVTPWQYDCMTVWLYDSMHDCIMTSDCMMTCDILTPVHGSSWQHTAATHFSCTSQCKYFTFRRSYYGGLQVYTLYYREQEDPRSERVKWKCKSRHVDEVTKLPYPCPIHNTLSDMEHVWMTL